MSAIRIDVGKSYSRYPAGRFASDGPYSGETFREQVLLPHLRRRAHIEVVLDNTAGYGSSFLEEAFGGLVRAGIAKRDLSELLVLITDDEGLKEEILGYMDDEYRRSHGRG